MRTYIPKRITADMIRKMASEADVSLAHITKTLGLSPAWMNRAMMGKETPNDKYRLLNPNPERMNRIYRYILDYKALQDKWRQHE